MKYVIIIPLLLTTILRADALEDIYSLYKAGQYRKACNKGLMVFNKYRKNPDFLMLYGFACLEGDYVDRVAVPMTGLRKSKTARANASYFATVLLEKKLLVHAIRDHVDISHLRLPATRHVISKVFQLFVDGHYTKEGNRYILKDPDRPNFSYRLYPVDHSKWTSMVIEEWKDGKRIKVHRYW